MQLFIVLCAPTLAVLSIGVALYCFNVARGFRRWL
jgi:hypothetical protein